MKSKYMALFQPINIGKVRIKNRFAMAPMAMARCGNDRAYKDESADYFVERAKGGTGLLITGANFCDDTIEKHLHPWFPCMTVNPLRYTRQLRKITDRVHAYGTKLFVQISAGLGRSIAPDMNADGTYVAPSETTNRWDPSIKHRALTTEEVYILIEQFAKSAVIAKKGGADGIEVHAVHEGYLLDSFTMEHYNKRDDEFGGEMRGRLRFPIALLEAVKRACGEDFPVILRLSLKSFIKDERRGILSGEENDFKELGRDIEEGLMFAKILTDAGYDGLDVDVGSYDAWYWPHPPFFFKKGLYLDFAKQVKAVTDKPIICAGRLDDPDLAAEAIESGAADMIGLGRPLLADPDFVNKILRDEIEDIRPCLCCHDGCIKRGNNMQLRSCSVNPACNREREAEIRKAYNPKDCVVVGAGPAGLEAARVLALRGHKVEVLEKADRVGGFYRYAVVPDFKDEGKALLRWYEHELNKLGVTVTFGYEAKAGDDKLQNADVVICATGSNAFISKVPGAQDSISAADALGGAELPGEVVIIGGEHIACELSIWLSQKGIKTAIVAVADKLMALYPPADMNKQMIEELLDFYDTEILLGRRLKEIRPGSIIVEKEGGAEEIPAKKVIIALGYRSETTLYDVLAASGLEVYNIGDSRVPRDIMSGIWDAHELCSNL